MKKIEQKIIKLLADYPEREFYAEELSKKLKFSKASASNILKFLAEKGIIFMRQKGHMKFYQINPKHPALKMFNIDSALEKVNSVLPKISRFSQKIILFGSSSRGEQTVDSDIDLFILSSEKDKIRQALKKVAASLRLKPIIKTQNEWSEMEITEPEFYQEVKNGITIYENVSRI